MRSVTCQAHYESMSCVPMTVHYSTGFYTHQRNAYFTSAASRLVKMGFYERTASEQHQTRLTSSSKTISSKWFSKFLGKGVNMEKKPKVPQQQQQSKGTQLLMGERSQLQLWSTTFLLARLRTDQARDWHGSGQNPPLNGKGKQCHAPL